MKTYLIEKILEFVRCFVLDVFFRGAIVLSQEFHAQRETVRLRMVLGVGGELEIIVKLEGNEIVSVSFVKGKKPYVVYNPEFSIRTTDSHEDDLSAE